MTDILGPANAANAVTARPSDTRIFSALDTWFRDCSSDTTDDGTDIQANWLNGMTAALRAVWRGNGNKLDGVTPIIAENGTDDFGLLSSVRQMIQRAQPARGIDTGTANAIAVALTPTCIELKDGLVLRIRKGATVNTAAVTLAVDGIAARPVVRLDGTALQPGDLPASANFEVIFDGASNEFVVTNFAGTSAYSAPLKLLNLKIPAATQFFVPTVGQVVNNMVVGPLGNNLSTSTWASNTLTIGAGEDGLWHIWFGASFGNLYSCAVYADIVRTRGAAVVYLPTGFMTYPGSNATSVADTFAQGSQIVDLQVGDQIQFSVGLQGPSGSYALQPNGPTPIGTVGGNVLAYRIEGLH